MVGGRRCYPSNDKVRPYSRQKKKKQLDKMQKARILHEQKI